MSFEDYISGGAVFCVTTGGVVAAAWLLTVGFLGHLHGAQRAVACALLATAGLVATHVVPGALGVLSRWAVLACAALLLVGAVVAKRRWGAERTRPAAERSAPSIRADGLALTLAGLAAACVAVCVLAQAWVGSATPTTGDDSLTFHLPNVARWIQSGTFWRVDQFSPLQANGNYPHNGDVIFLAAVLPWRSDAFVNLVNVPFGALTGLATYAIARELGAVRAPSILLASALVALPVVALVLSDGTYTDMVLAATFAGGALFLLRSLRTSRRSDLVLAGLGLGLAFGTKWYGVTAVPLLVLAWAVASLTSRGRWRRVARDVALVVGLVVLTGGFWLVRNWVESGNPVMPVRVGLGGIEIFDAAPDVVRACTGFSLADYATSGRVWIDYLVPQYRYILGLPGLAILLTSVATVGLVLARRSRSIGARRGPILVAAAAVGAMLVTFFFTPYTALGLEGKPVAAGGNVRYFLPGILLASALGACLPRGRPAALFALAIVVAVVHGLALGYELAASTLAATAAVIATGAAAALMVIRVTQSLAGRTRLALRLGAGGLAVIALVVVGYLRQDDFTDGRYRGDEPAIDWILRNAPEGQKVGIAGLWDSRGLVPVLPAFGPSFENEVAYVGQFKRGLLHEYERPAAFLSAVRRGGYDLLIVGNDVYPKGCRLPGSGRQENAWAREAGYVRLAASPRLILYEVR
jgi:Dolichyl-phosphate-mannose-protein mannosyltransferase